MERAKLTEVSKLSFVDTHSHLAMLEHDPLDAILRRAEVAGIKKMISVSTDEPSWESNRNLALAHPHIYYTLGLHPHDAVRWAECAGNLQALLANGVPEKCVAIGELGLDFHYDFSPREMQLDVLEAQFAIARKYELPVVIHCRDAFDDLYGMIRRVGLSFRGGVMHCFTGDAARAKEAIDLGLHISFSGILTFKNAAPIRDAAKTLPDDAILLETDCPYLAPMPFRGKPNEPAFLAQTAEVLASVRGATTEHVAEVTSRNAIRLFRLT